MIETKSVPTIEEIHAELCRRSFFYFLQQFWETIIPEPPVYNWHIQYLCDETQKVVQRVIDRQDKEYDLIINIPPGTTKSTIVTVMLPVWCWINDPTLRVLSASYSGVLSTDHSVKSRDIIRSDKFRAFFGSINIKKDRDGKTHYINTDGGERFATSVTGSITGFHAHLLIVDDPLNPKEASSETERERANEFMSTTLSTRKVSKSITPTILVMQRLHQDDCTGSQLKKGGNVKHICLPGELSQDVKPVELREKYVDGLLDPVRLKRADLNELRTALGSYGYSGQIMQTPAPAEGAVWQKWIKPVPDETFPSELERLGTDWDLAYTEKQSNSASAFITAGMVGNDMYIDDLGFNWLEFPDLIKWMRQQKAPHYIEAKASGKSAKQTLTKNGIPAIEVKVDGGDKIARARMATPYAEAGLVYCRASILEKLYNDEQQGILRFPNTGDDLQDALVQAIARLLGQPDIFVF